MNLSTCIDWTLRLLQIMGFIAAILKVSFQNQYTDNVQIFSLDKDESGEFIQKYRAFKSFEHCPAGPNQFLIAPKGTSIKYLRFYELEFRDDTNQFKEKMIKCYNDVEDSTGFIVITSVPDNIPILRVKWETSSGEIGSYTFRFNGFNGYSDMTAYKYSMTWKRKLFSILTFN